MPPLARSGEVYLSAMETEASALWEGSLRILSKVAPERRTFLSWRGARFFFYDFDRSVGQYPIVPADKSGRLGNRVFSRPPRLSRMRTGVVGVMAVRRPVFFGPTLRRSARSSADRQPLASGWLKTRHTLSRAQTQGASSSGGDSSPRCPPQCKHGRLGETPLPGLSQIVSFRE
jgi:hypothetical protein